MISGHGNQHEPFAWSILMHSAIKGVFRKPVKWHKLFQSLTSSTFDNLRISDVGEVCVQPGSRKQTTTNDGRNIFDACQVIDILLISNGHREPLAEMISMCHQR